MILPRLGCLTTGQLPLKAPFMLPSPLPPTHPGSSSPIQILAQALDLCRLACTSRAIQSTILGSERWREALEGRRMAFAFAGFVPRMKTGRGDGVRQIEKEVLCMDKFAAAR
ncbi:hypothetical protein ACKKBF_B30790 [Auxenochlorella protothecoides x Auxenochlorella symbiontica]